MEEDWGEGEGGEERSGVRSEEDLLDHIVPFFSFHCIFLFVEGGRMVEWCPRSGEYFSNQQLAAQGLTLAFGNRC